MNSVKDNQAILCHVAIQTHDFQRSFAFYTELLGLRVLKAPFRFKGKRTLAWLDAGNILMELYSIKDGKTAQSYDSNRIGPDHIAFRVQNLDSILLKLRQNRINVIKDPFYPSLSDSPRERIVFIEGVDGEEIELVENVPASSAPA